MRGEMRFRPFAGTEEDFSHTVLPYGYVEEKEPWWKSLFPPGVSPMALGADEESEQIRERRTELDGLRKNNVLAMRFGDGSLGIAFVIDRGEDGAVYVNYFGLRARVSLPRGFHRDATYLPEMEVIAVVDVDLWEEYIQKWEKRPNLSEEEILSTFPWRSGRGKHILPEID